MGFLTSFKNLRTRIQLKKNEKLTGKINDIVTSKHFSPEQVQTNLDKLAHREIGKAVAKRLAGGAVVIGGGVFAGKKFSNHRRKKQELRDRQTTQGRPRSSRKR